LKTHTRLLLAAASAALLAGWLGLRGANAALAAKATSAHVSTEVSR
jgi:hypothetical protein